MAKRDTRGSDFAGLILIHFDKQGNTHADIVAAQRLTARAAQAFAALTANSSALWPWHMPLRALVTRYFTWSGFMRTSFKNSRANMICNSGEVYEHIDTAKGLQQSIYGRIWGHRMHRVSRCCREDAVNKGGKSKNTHGMKRLYNCIHR